MNIAILGNGKMGKRISELASKKGYKIVVVSSSKKPANTLDLSASDVAIDFSTPDSAFDNIKHAIKSGIPVISGTTGWLEKIDEIKSFCKIKKGAFLYSSNFSLGMNLFLELNKQLAKLMKKKNYITKIHEVHHTEKLDSPSGTSENLAQDIHKSIPDNIPITSERTGNVSGIHIITYDSIEDTIEIKHTAKNRDGFAIGAIIAAKWIVNKKGVFSMKDVLSI